MRSFILFLFLASFGLNSVVQTSGEIETDFIKLRGMTATVQIRYDEWLTSSERRKILKGKTITTSGQSPFKPTIITLEPYIIKYDPASFNEISTLDSLSKIGKEIPMHGFGTDPEKELILDSLFEQFKTKMSFGASLTLEISAAADADHTQTETSQRI